MNTTKWRSKIISLFSLVLLLFCFSNCQTTEVEDIPVSIYEYGICVDSFQVIKGQVQNGQTLGAILYLNHIDHGRIDQIVRQSKGIFDFRKAKVGKNYTVICSDDSLQIAQYFIYENTSTEYIVFDIRDTIKVYKGQKEIRNLVAKLSLPCGMP